MHCSEKFIFGTCPVSLPTSTAERILDALKMVRNCHGRVKGDTLSGSNIGNENKELVDMPYEQRNRQLKQIGCDRDDWYYRSIILEMFPAFNSHRRHQHLHRRTCPFHHQFQLLPLPPFLLPFLLHRQRRRHHRRRHRLNIERKTQIGVKRNDIN